MSSEIAVRLEGVTKDIKGQQVLCDINLEVLRGEVCGFVGRNASGKTMLFRVICGLVFPTRGRVMVMGKEIGRNGLIPDSVGAIIEHPGFLGQYTGKRNLQLLASIRGIVSERDIEDSMQQVGLDPGLRKPVRAYSLGMKQRLGIAQAIMEEPDMLVLDEPTNSLDEEGVELFIRIVHRYRQAGKTVLLASHVREEIRSLCDRVFYMNRGCLSTEGPQSVADS